MTIPSLQTMPTISVTGFLIGFLLKGFKALRLSAPASQKLIESWKLGDIFEFSGK
jgi:hypothetical protein